MEYPVADLELARRLELAEARGNAEYVEARAKAFPDSGAEWIEVAGARVMYDGADSPCTQTFALGMFQPIDAPLMQRVEDFFHTRRAPAYHEVCPLADGSFIALLHERGYRPNEFSNVLYRPIDCESRKLATPSYPIQVRRMEAGEEERWAHVAADGWQDVAPQLRDFILEMAPVLRHRRHAPSFFAEMDGQPVAVGALCLFEGVALLAGACTIPQFRKRGAQRALLEHRLRYGLENGCDIAMMVAQPGSSSQRNAERQGFRIAYTRTKWCLPLPAPM
jgi:hypothetical protein